MEARLRWIYLFIASVFNPAQSETPPLLHSSEEEYRGQRNSSQLELSVSGLLEWSSGQESVASNTVVFNI